MNQPIVVIVTAAAVDDANAVWEAWGKGPGNLSRRLTDDPAPTTSSTVTHYLMADSSTSVEDVQIIQGFANGDLPPISGAWGEGGIIEAAAALTAINASNLQCYSASGNVTPVDHVNAILASRDLAYVPDEV